MQFTHCSPTLVIRRSLFVALLSLTACDLLTAPSVATTIMLSPTEVTFDGLGDDLRVNATVKDQHGNVMSNDTITWTASDRGVATVSLSGQCTYSLMTPWARGLIFLYNVEFLSNKGEYYSSKLTFYGKTYHLIFSKNKTCYLLCSLILISTQMTYKLHYSFSWELRSLWGNQ